MAKEKWVKEFRPKTLDEIVGQPHIVPRIRGILASGNLSNLTFIGRQGTGKTSLAEVIARTLFKDEWTARLHRYNASKERGIDLVRGEISRRTRMKGKRIILLDEVDNMTPDAQFALRGLMELENSEAIYILTGNYFHKILPALISRTSVFFFTPLEESLIKEKMVEIIKRKNIKVDSKAIAGLKRLAKYVKGDLRLAINTLQSIVDNNKEITEETVAFLERLAPVEQIVRTAVNGDFFTAKKQIEKHYIISDFSSDTVTEQLYEAIEVLYSTNGDEKPLLTENQAIALYSHIAEIGRWIRMGCDPKIELVSFLSKCWIVRHLPDELVILNEAKDSGI